MTGVGLNEHGMIFWEDSSPQVSSCLPFPNIEDRLQRMCSGHERARTCGNLTEDASSLLFDKCKRNTCVGRINTVGVNCRLFDNPQGANVSSENELKCGLPLAAAETLGVWRLPTWIDSIGGEGNYHCMTPFPNGTDLHWRLICVDGKPEVEVRIKLPKAFLKGYYKPQCIVRDRCGGASVFTSDAICFETPGGTNRWLVDPLTDDDLELLNKMDADRADGFGRLTSALFLTVLSLLFCALY